MQPRIHTSESTEVLKMIPGSGDILVPGDKLEVTETSDESPEGMSIEEHFAQMEAKRLELIELSKRNHKPGMTHKMSNGTIYYVSPSGAWLNTTKQPSKKARHRKEVAARKKN